MIPHAGIREYDQALEAMEHMREALYNSLSSQWAARQEREGEIGALAHDLKTPLTLIRGNGELLLRKIFQKTAGKWQRRSCPAAAGRKATWPGCWKPVQEQKKNSRAVT